MHLDRDLVEIAAEASRPLSAAQPEAAHIAAWLGAQLVGTKDEWLARLMIGDDPALPADLLQRFVADQSPGPTAIGGTASRRTADDLLRAAETRRNERERIAAEKAAAAKIRREREAAATRARQLDLLAGREAQLWTKVEELATTRLPKDYDEAVRLLVDLRDLSARGDATVFQSQLAGFRSAHMRKPSLLARLQQAVL